LTRRVAFEKDDDDLTKRRVKFQGIWVTSLKRWVVLQKGEEEFQKRWEDFEKLTFLFDQNQVF